MIIVYNFKGEDFEFEVTSEDIKEYLKTRPKNELLDIILELIEEIDLFDHLKDELTDYFEDDAKSQYEATKDPLGYVGMSQSDFI